LANTSGASISLANNNAQNWNGNFTFAGTSDLNLGTGAVTMNASRAVTVSAGNLTVGGAISGATFGLTKAGTGTLTLSANNTYTGATTVSGGTLVIGSTGSYSNAATVTSIVGGSGSAASLLVNGVVTAGNTTLNIGTAANDRATATITTNATLYNSNLGTASGSAGALNITGGTTTIADAGNAGSGVYLGSTGGYGYLRMAGGNLTVQEFDVSNAGNGVADISSGTLTVNLWFNISQRTTGNGVLNVTGGTINATNTNAIGFARGAGAMVGTNLINIGQGGFFNAGGKTVSLVGNAISTNATSLLTLAGGTLTAGAVASNSGTSILNFNGGTLKAGASTTTFLQGLTSAFVASGGGTIDNGNFNITIAQNLLAATGNGISSITLSSNGSGYIGAPVVQITGGGGSGATAIANFDSTTGTITGITVTSPGSGYTSTPTITLVGGGSTSNATVSTVTMAANTSGGLTFNGTGTTTLSGANTYTGTTTVNAGTLAFGANQTLGAIAGAGKPLPLHLQPHNKLQQQHNLLGCHFRLGCPHEERHRHSSPLRQQHELRRDHHQQRHAGNWLHGPPRRGNLRGKYLQQRHIHLLRHKQPNALRHHLWHGGAHAKRQRHAHPFG
jgi:autotransporter-associated beta strand protein